MSTTTDQKLTADEAIAEAQALGFTEIQTIHQCPDCGQLQDFTRQVRHSLVLWPEE